MNRQQAEILSLKALTYMAENEDIFTGYFNLSGISPEELRHSLTDPSVLASILDYFLQNEKKLIAFCTSENIKPDLVVKARQELPGGEIPPFNM